MVGMKKIFAFGAGLILLFGLAGIAQAGTKAADKAGYNILFKNGEVRNVAAPELPRYMASDEVELVTPNRYRKIQAKYPNDTNFGYQWYLEQASGADMDAPQAWGAETGRSGVVVAVVDTGSDMDHPDLVKNFWVNPGEIPGNHIDDDDNGYVDDVHGWNFLDDNNNLNPVPDGGPDYGVNHGTHVAGIIGAVGNNGLGVAGVCWDVSLMIIKVLDDEGVGNTYDIARGIRYARENGADIINLSWGGYVEADLEKDEIADAQAAGISTVAALGNDSVNVNNQPIYPACYTQVLGVTATNSNDNASRFTNYGSDCADVAAPGSAIYSTLFHSGLSPYTQQYGYLSGTSMAAPMVSGVAALLKSYIGSEGGSSINNAIMASAEDVGLPANMGAGRVNARSALDALEDSSIPERPKKIKCYRGAKKKKKIKRNIRVNDSMPYCTWKKGEAGDDIAGYYVYYGTRKKSNPAKRGDFQAGRSWTPRKPRTGNETAFYLKVKSVNAAGNVSKGGRKFKFVIDTNVNRPKMKNIARKSDGLKVRWRIRKKEHIAKYRIYRWNNKKKKYVKIKTVPGHYHYYIDAKAKRGRTYKYKIKAVDDLGNVSKYSKRRKKYY